MFFRRNVLAALRRRILEIANMTKQSLWYTVKYLFERDEESCRNVLRIEEESDRANLEVIDTTIEHLDKHCVRGRELREFLMLMEISAIFERICDLLEKICKMKVMGGDIADSIREKLIWMTKRVITMIEFSENAMKEEDVEELKANLERIDDEIDQLFESCKEEIIEHLKGGGDEHTYANLLYVIGYLERIGDLAAKIGSRLIYIYEAKHVFIK